MSLTSIRIRPYTEFLRTATGFDKLKILKQSSRQILRGKFGGSGRFGSLSMWVGYDFRSISISGPSLVVV